MERQPQDSNNLFIYNLSNQIDFMTSHLWFIKIKRRRVVVYQN